MHVDPVSPYPMQFPARGSQSRQAKKQPAMAVVQHLFPCTEPSSPGSGDPVSGKRRPTAPGRGCPAGLQPKRGVKSPTKSAVAAPPG